MQTLDSLMMPGRAARLLGKKPAQVRALMEEGVLPFRCVLGPRKRVAMRDVLRFIAVHDLPVPAELRGVR